MRRLLYPAIALLLSPLAAMAQNVICATAPAGDSSNRCASTAFVQGAISGFGGNPTALVGLTPINGSASTFIRSDGAPAIDQSIAPNWTGIHSFTAANVLIGATTAVPIGALTPRLQLHGTTSTGASYISQTSWVNNLGGPILNFAKSRGGLVGTRGLVQNGDFLGSIQAYGDDGANFIPAAEIHFNVNGITGANDMPGRIDFRTTADGSSTTTSRLTISANGVANFTSVPTMPQPGFNNYLSATPWNDQSTIIGSPTRFWFPDYFGNPAVGIVSKFNRLQVGVAALSGANIPATPSTWTHDYWGGTSDVSTVSVINALGQSAISGFARTSDYRLWLSSYSKGSQGVNGFALNDELGTGGNSIAAALYGVALHNPNVIGLTEAIQLEIGTAEPSPAITPYGGVVSKSTMGVNVTAGYGAAVAPFDENASTAINIGFGTAAFKSGMIIGATALEASRGGGGLGVAIELAASTAAGHSIRWLDNLDATKAEIWGTASGLHSGTAIQLPSGLVSAPALALGGEAVGLYHPASNQLALVVSAFAAQTIYPNGSVHIGNMSDGTRRFNVGLSDAVNNNVTIVSRFAHATTGTPSLGIGVGVEFVAETSANNNEIGATIEAVTTNVGAGTEAFDLVFRTMTAGATAAEVVRMGPGGIASVTTVKTGATTVGALPTCNAGARGIRYYVTDANATTFASTVAGGGANNVPVNCNGTNWIIGANDIFEQKAKAA